MIKTIIRAMYSAFISIVLISIVMAGWACFAFISQPTKSGDIFNLIQDMYESQKSVIIDVVDLSKLLIKDKIEIIDSEDNNFLAESESELVTDQEDNGDNPLGIIVEPSLPELIEEDLPEISEEPLENDHSEVSMNEMEIGMEMN